MKHRGREMSIEEEGITPITPENRLNLEKRQRSEENVLYE